MTDNKNEELSEGELDQVTGGVGGKGLIAHELTHVQQQGGTQYIGETEKNLSLGNSVKRGVKGVVKTGGGNDI